MRHDLAALDRVLPVLSCAVCGNELSRLERTVACSDGHRFDVARSGYLNMLVGAPRRAVGDTAAMVDARVRFLRSGHLDPVDALLRERARRHATRRDPLVVELGAGPGIHLAHVVDAMPGAVGVAIDVSKAALRRAARVHPRVVAVAGDVWRELPLRDGAAHLVLCVFAPRDGGETRRILDREGRLIVVMPTAHHLAELVGPLGLVRVDPLKEQRLAAKLEPFFTEARRDLLEIELALSHEDVVALVAMGPSTRHVDPQALGARLRSLPPVVTATASVAVVEYTPRPSPATR